MPPFRTSVYDRFPQPVLLGHRGLNTVAPENTLPAIEQASAQGADGVEIDVRLCRLGKPVVIHDADLSRLTNGADRRKVATMDASELHAVNLGGGSGVPLLSEVLKRCQELQLLVNIELKRDVSSRIRLVRATLATLGDMDMAPAVVISSFDPFMLFAVRALSRATAIALLLHKDGPRLPAHLLTALLGASAVHIDPPLATASAIQRWHNRGVRVLVWTVNQPSTAKNLLDIGVNGIISDDPATMQPMLMQHRDDNPAQ